MSGEITVSYDSNNSGGRWWLADDDWRKLEKAGWVVEWRAERRWLGALATSAKRVGLSLREAVDEWERVTGRSSTEAGCACCGQPHFFTATAADGTHAGSGPDITYEAHWP